MNHHFYYTKQGSIIDSSHPLEKNPNIIEIDELTYEILRLKKFYTVEEIQETIRGLPMLDLWRMP